MPVQLHYINNKEIRTVPEPLHLKYKEIQTVNNAG